MKYKKALTVGFVLLVLCAVGLFFFSSRYMILHGEIVSRSVTDIVLKNEKLPDATQLQKLENLENLDLRNMDIQPEEYENLQVQLPDCNIIWNVPLQNEYWDNTVSQVSVTHLDRETIDRLKYFPNLQTVDAHGCRDYDVLMELAQTRPDLKVLYSFDMGEYQLSNDAAECIVTNENIDVLLEALNYLPNLRAVEAVECTDYEALMQLQQEWPELEVNYAVILGGSSYDGKSTQLTLGISQAQEALDKLRYFPDLNSVTFTGMATDCDLMFELKCRYPNTVFEWSFELFGVQTSSTAKELILNEIPMESTEAVEDSLKYFYNLEWVEMCQCGIPSEDMDALWKRHPETRFVWAIPMGDGFVRTDVNAFIPYKYGYNITNPFYDQQAKELKYLVDLECLDLGHMRMMDISFLQYMPKLRFLILADVICEDFSYMAGLTNLEYIELFRSKFDDVQLLMNMKNLRELNIGWTNLKNPEKLKEMTWLTRLWASMNGMTGSELEDLRDSLPDTLVYINSRHPTEGGWRGSDLYCEMRDLLGMFYMD